MRLLYYSGDCLFSSLETDRVDSNGLYFIPVLFFRRCLAMRTASDLEALPRTAKDLAMTDERFLQEFDALLARAKDRDVELCFVIAVLEDALFKLRPERARLLQALRETGWSGP
jgi:hypothetical protein